MLGNPATRPSVKEAMFAETLRDDLRVAARRLAHRPGFTAVAVLTLALGLGANIAIFTLVQATLLQRLPVARPDELVRLGDNDNCCVNGGLQTSYSLFSYSAYLHLRDRMPELASLAAFQAAVQPMGIRRVGTAVTESMPGEFVSANYFTTFGVRPAAGRLLDPADDRPGAQPVFVMSHRAWRARFGGDASIVGASFLVLGKPMTLAGVAAPEFFGDTVRADPAAVWLPVGQEPYARAAASFLQRPDQDWLYLIGRMRPGATLDQVEARATRALQTWLAAQSFLDADGRKQIDRQHIPAVTASGGVTLLRYTYERPLTLLFATSLLVLLIAAANLANLLLARTDPGQIAIQTALGASSGRLVQQSLSEGALLAIAGVSLGLVVASLSTRSAVSLTFAGAEYIPLDLRPTAGVVAFALGLAIATGALFSAAPAWAMARTNPGDALGGAGRNVEQRSFLPRRSLVIAQVALSLVALASAGLLTESLRRLEQQPLGFNTDGRIVARIGPAAPVDDLNRLAVYYDRMLLRLRQIPGVLDATYSQYSPMEGNNWQNGISIAGRPPAPQPESSSWNRIGPHYFETLGTRVVRGRTIDERDTMNAPFVAVVNEAFVRRFFPDSDPIGRRLGIGGPAHAGDFEIVGVSEDVKYIAAQRPTRPMIFFPALQVVAYDDATARSMQLRSLLMRAVELHVAPGTASIEPMLRRALADVDPDLTVVRVVPMATQVGLNFRLNRLMARLTGAYGLLALVVAAIGLYGVTAYAVARRTREIGVRMALGADRSRVVADVLRGALAQTAIGLIIGLPLAVLAAGTLASLLFGVTSRDPLVFAQAALVLVLSAAVAALVPARRAASIDPARALRSD
ncbi:MAG: ABC transporter substrate-binding protein [Acidobacteria bacterium]|nr:MAG: ABC transporter substrate-binding protein [Acidobacteriota bacterium]